MGLTCAFVLEGKAQARFAIANGAVISLFFVTMFFVLQQRVEMPSAVFLASPFLFMGGLMASGYLHLNDEEQGSLSSDLACVYFDMSYDE